MKSKIRIAYLAFFLVFILSLFSINVFADEEIGDDPEPATDAPVVTRAAPATAAPKTKPSTQSTSKKKSSTYATQKIKYSSKKSTYATKSTSNVNNNVSRNTQATKNSSVSSTKANTSAVYNVKKEKVATDTLKKNDWASIAEQLNKSDSDDTKTDVESFDYIKNNSSEGDNGIWILYAGIGLEIVAALIIITLIILAVRRKKRMSRQAYAPESPRNASQAQAERAAYQQRAPQRNPQRAPQHSASRTQKRNVNKRSKFDTDDVYVNEKPRRSGRYKPRH